MGKHKKQSATTASATIAASPTARATPTSPRLAMPPLPPNDAGLEANSPNSDAAENDGPATEGLQVGNTPSNAPSSSTSDPRLANAVKTLNAGFGEAVALLMRDEKHRHLGLADLEWLLLPPLTTNQALTLRGKVRNKAGDKAGDANGQTVPLGLALWANVSSEIDQKLEAQRVAGAPLRLAPRDWTSGDIPWLVLAVAPRDLRQKLVAKVRETLGDGMKVFELGTSSTSAGERDLETPAEISSKP